MQYFKIAGKVGTFVEYDDTTGRANIIVKSDIVQQRLDLIARIGAPDPEQPTTNAAWIAWGKAHYPYMNHDAEIAELARIDAIIAAIKDL